MPQFAQTSPNSHPLPWVRFYINYQIFHSTILIFIWKPHTTAVLPGKAQILRPSSSGTLLRGSSNTTTMAQTSSLKIFTPFIGHLQYHFGDFVQFFRLQYAPHPHHDQFHALFHRPSQFWGGNSHCNRSPRGRHRRADRHNIRQRDKRN